MMKHSNRVLLLQLCDEEGMSTVIEELCHIYSSDIALALSDSVIDIQNSKVLENGFRFLRDSFKVLKGVHNK